jgi:hypothetical protein
VEGSRYNGGSEILVRGGPEENIEREASVSFPSQWSVPGGGLVGQAVPTLGERGLLSGSGD